MSKLSLPMSKGESITIDGKSKITFERSYDDGRIRVGVDADQKTEIKRTDTLGSNSKKEPQSK